MLNRLREAKGFNTLPLKPHAGEAGSRHHMATAFLLADSVNHGIKLQENPTLQYLFYLAQIGLATCPISNHALFMELDKSPIGGCAQPSTLLMMMTSQNALRLAADTLFRCVR